MSLIQCGDCGGAMVLSDTNDPSSSLVCSFVAVRGQHRAGGYRAERGVNQEVNLRMVRSGAGRTAGRTTSSGPGRELNESEKPRLRSCNKCGERSFDCLKSNGGNGHFKCQRCGYQFADFTRLAQMRAEAKGIPMSQAGRELNDEWDREREKVEDPHRRGDAVYIPQK